MDRGVAPSKIDEQLKNTFMENPEEAYNVQMELIRIHINRVRNRIFPTLIRIKLITFYQPCN